jgi:hypothetical protein
MLDYLEYVKTRPCCVCSALIRVRRPAGDYLLVRPELMHPNSRAAIAPERAVALCPMHKITSPVSAAAMGAVAFWRHMKLVDPETVIRDTLNGFNFLQHCLNSSAVRERLTEYGIDAREVVQAGRLTG